MDLIQFRAYCLSKPGVEETLPFDENTLAFKVMGKIFAITGLDSLEFTVNLKCDPEWALELREQYPEVQPGYHMSKKHWNTVHFEGELTEDLLIKMVDHSYHLVVKGLPKKMRQELEK